MSNLEEISKIIAEGEGTIPGGYIPTDEMKELEHIRKTSQDIYAVKARVRNYTTVTGAALTSLGEALCNTYVHVLMKLYRFSDEIHINEGEDLRAILREIEKMPADFILTVTPKPKKAQHNEDEKI